jgi:hypothetical protein
MEKEFVPYEIAVQLKELGFDEYCMEACYYEFHDRGKTHIQLHTPDEIMGVKEVCKAPLFQQAFRWFREKYNLKSCVIFRHNMEDGEDYYDWLIQGEMVVYRHFNSYVGAELACLKKLIEIAKTR